jgi:HPt (histidine-containing phosphotransfer) domain-containing protein
MFRRRRRFHVHAPPQAPPIVSQFAADPEMRDLLEFFVGALPERVGALESALAEARLRDLQRLAHQIKGAAGGYGYPVLGQAAAALEGSLKSREPQPPEKIQKEVNDLIALCQRAIAGGTGVKA